MKFICRFGMMFVFLLLAVNAQADVEQLKLYKKVYPDSKPNCLFCHAVEKPKKEEGQHELNDYGKKLKETATEEKTKDAKPTEDIYKKVGKSEDFKK